MRLIISTLIILPLSLWGQTLIWQDNFESNAPNFGGGDRFYSQGGSEGSSPAVCGSSDYFFRTDCNPTGGTGPCTGVSETFLQNEGNFMWRGEDLDGCVVDPDFLTFENIDVSGLTLVQFAGLFACDGAVNEWEGVGAADGHPDYISIDYALDNGSYIEGLVFRSDGSDNASTGDNRGLFRVDTDGDGFGDGLVSMGETFNEYSFMIDISGANTLSIRALAYVNGGGEEFAFDDFRIYDQSTLPVTLLYFKGKKYDESIRLTWATQNEVNHNRFEVEKRTSDKWKSKVSIEDSEILQGQNIYEWTDESPDFGLNHYRLKQIDLDDNVTYYKDIRIELEKFNSHVLNIFPNPFFGEELNINFQNSKFLDKELSIEIYSPQGELLQSLIIRSETKQNTPINPQLPKGIYYYLIRLRSEWVQSGKLLKL